MFYNKNVRPGMLFVTKRKTEKVDSFINEQSYVTKSTNTSLDKYLYGINW